ncbi:toprim domain-containing protein [Fervidibacillus halotolerans]|uniref:Toprim domain-containing protein n=1 Tax=Fervidibacillus halotolerans TaxID=2980027 RepID=A0A9E8LYH5_9BACI|nr:toprim domain-containing protein [Fervidibacillus halotolerans]WAA11914.1 toprim domain-containing protein [Fervidibacillus halotolerans]
MPLNEKVIIVEGMTDKRRILDIVNEPVDIICTNGTIGVTKLDELVDQFYDKEVYIFVDADESGEKLRKLLKRELPHAKHLYIHREYREVATAPKKHLSAVLLQANIKVKGKYLL